MTGDDDKDKSRKEEDLSNEDLPTSTGESEFETEPYDPRPGEDEARKYMAYALLSLLSFIIVYILVGVVCDWLEIEDAKSLLQLILSPVIALVSAATGFYYGAKTIESRNP